MNKIYTGIGSRETPNEILKEMYKTAKLLGKEGYTLRSGKAKGADTYFQLGAQKVNGELEIYVPWKNFNCTNEYNPHAFELNHSRDILIEDKPEATEIAKRLHPNWSACTQGAKKLHTRNVHQILGADLETPSDFVLYWAPLRGISIQGGTKTAIRLAHEYNIPTIRIDFNTDWKNLLKEIMES